MQIEDEDDVRKENLDDGNLHKIPLDDQRGQEILEMFEKTLSGTLDSNGKPKSKVAPIDSGDFQKIVSG